VIEKKDEIGLLNGSINKLSTENGRLQVEVEGLLATIERDKSLKNISQDTDVTKPSL